MSDPDILCTECRDGTSKAPNEIVICDVCNQGFHQFCHKPKIPDSILEPDVPWICRTCIYALGTKKGGAEKDTPIGKALKATKTVLPYDLNSLTWNTCHQVNRENIYCYCGGPGKYHCCMLQCHRCLQWFHEACLQQLDAPLLYGDHYYTFTCGVCNKGQEMVKRIVMKWSEMIAIVLNNLCLIHGKRFFDLQAEIVPFIQKNAHRLKVNVDLSNLKEEELCEKVSSVLCRYKKKFISGRVAKKRCNVWSLRVPFPFTKPLIFAPPFAISGDMAKAPKTTKPCSDTVCPSPSRSRSPPSFPLIYGACRKGASIYPSHPPKKSTKERNKKKSEQVSDSLNCSPSTSSITIPPKEEKIINKTEKKVKKHTHKHSSSKYTSHNSSSDSSDLETSSPELTLDSVIPRPENFEGQNNPFFDLYEKNENFHQLHHPYNHQHNRHHHYHHNYNHKSKKNNKSSDQEEGYKVIQSSTSSKLTLKRITNKKIDKGSQKLLSLTDNHMDQILDQLPSRKEKTRKCVIKAQRLTCDGKLEYLLEWD